MADISEIRGLSAAREGLRALLLREGLLEVEWISDLEQFDEPPFGPRLADFEYLDDVESDERARVQVILAAEYLTWLLAQLRTDPPSNGVPLVAVTFIDDTDGTRLTPSEPTVERAPLPNLYVVPGSEAPEALRVSPSTPTPLAKWYTSWLTEAVRAGLANPALEIAEIAAHGDSPHRLVMADPQWLEREGEDDGDPSSGA